ncbi:unnamed protein product [Phaeothamnion confervicola]
MCQSREMRKTRGASVTSVGYVSLSFVFFYALAFYLQLPPATSLWSTACLTHVACEALRLEAKHLILRIRPAPSQDIVEVFGNQAVSLAVSLYVSTCLLFGGSYAFSQAATPASVVATTAVAAAAGTAGTASAAGGAGNVKSAAAVSAALMPPPLFLTPAAAAATNVPLFQHLGALLLAYILLDTAHLVRAWRLAPNAPMLLHHALFGAVLAIGVALEQRPEQFRMHAVLFGAELSTPLLNLRWILTKGLGYRPRALLATLSLGFAAIFFATRIVGYGLLLLEMHADPRSDVHLWRLAMPPPVAASFATLLWVAFALNVYWAWLIVAAFFKPRGRPPPRPAPTRDDSEPATATTEPLGKQEPGAWNGSGSSGGGHGGEGVRGMPTENEESAELVVDGGGGDCCERS